MIEFVVPEEKEVVQRYPPESKRKIHYIPERAIKCFKGVNIGRDLSSVSERQVIEFKVLRAD